MPLAFLVSADRKPDHAAFHGKSDASNGTIRAEKQPTTSRTGNYRQTVMS